MISNAIVHLDSQVRISKKRNTKKKIFFKSKFNLIGKRCEIKVDLCGANNPCQNNGICLDKLNSFECICRPGWSGELAPPLIKKITIKLILKFQFLNSNSKQVNFAKLTLIIVKIVHAKIMVNVLI